MARKQGRPTTGERREQAKAEPILGDPKNAYEVASLLHYPDSLDPDVLETPFQRKVIKMATSLGLLIFHNLISEGSQPGFPDLVLVGWGGIAFVELKREDGRIEPEQEVWNFAIARIARLSFGLIHVGIYRPSDFVIDGPLCQLLAKLARPTKVLRLHARMRAAGIDTTDLAA